MIEHLVVADEAQTHLSCSDLHVSAFKLFIQVLCDLSVMTPQLFFQVGQQIIDLLLACDLAFA